MFLRYLSQAILLFYLICWPVKGEEHLPLKPVEREIEIAYQSAIKAMQGGPKDIPLAGQAILKLPHGYGFIPHEQAAHFMKTLGNQISPDFLGLIMPSQGPLQWFMDVEYRPEGYIKDDEAKDWNSDDLLNKMIAGTEAGNADRVARGLPEIEIAGWVEKPNYDPVSHRLVWSVAIRAKHNVSDREQGVNYNTLMLGREGYISMNLITGRTRVESLKPVAKQLLAGLEFNSGKSYADFRADSDKVAEYGLAALVAGAAAKKLGLFAVLATFLVKFAKVIIIAAAAGVGGLTKVFRNKKS